MSNGIGTVEVRTARKKLIVQGLGKTPRGTKFIRKTEELAVTKISDPKFKGEMAAAVEKLLG